VDRRRFLGTAAATAGVLLLKPELVSGRPQTPRCVLAFSGAGGAAPKMPPIMIDTGGARVVALADLFQDQLDKARETFNKNATGERLRGAGRGATFRGADAFHQIAASKELDAIVIATPPYYHPRHLRRRSPRASTFISKSRWLWMCPGF